MKCTPLHYSLGNAHQSTSLSQGVHAAWATYSHLLLIFLRDGSERVQIFEDLARSTGLRFGSDATGARACDERVNAGLRRGMPKKMRGAPKQSKHI